MRLVRTSLLGLLLAVAVGSLATAAPALPSQISNLVFGPTMARADIVATTKGVVGLHRVERGRIQALGGTSIVLLWRDGTTTTVPVDARALVTGPAGRPLKRGLAALRRGHHVVTVRGGSQPATRVHVLPATAAMPRWVLGNALGQALSRAGIVHRSAAGTSVYWVDRGRIRALGPDTITLRERDGSTPELALAPDAIVTGGGPPVGRGGVPRLRRGMLVETVREGDGPVARVHVLRR